MDDKKTRTISWDELDELEQKVAIKIDQLVSLSELIFYTMTKDCDDFNNLADLMVDTLKIVQDYINDWISEQMKKTVHNNSGKEKNDVIQQTS